MNFAKVFDKFLNSGQFKIYSFNRGFMKALIFREKGSLSNLKLEECPEPAPGANEVLIELKAASINPSDFKNVLGKMTATTLPRIPGRDFAGKVIAGPSEWMGKEVFGMGEGLGLNRNGSHAQKMAVPISALVNKPTFLSFSQAAAMTLPYITAWNALVTIGQIKASETLLITGATGAVGSAAIRIAKLKGAKVIGTVRQGHQGAALNSLPADHWIPLEGNDFSDAVFKLTDGRGAEMVLDLVGGTLFESCIKSLAQKGRQIAMASNEPRVCFNLLDFYHRQAHLMSNETAKLSFAECAAILTQLLPGFEKGELKAPEIESIGLEKAIEAYGILADGKAKKKFVIEFP